MKKLRPFILPRLACLNTLVLIRPIISALNSKDRLKRTISLLITNASSAIELPDLSATETLGSLLADELAAGDVISLSGPLGAGKSALARAIIQAANPAETDVPSPTFTLFAYELGNGTHFGILIFTGLKPLKMQCSLGWMMRLSMRFV